MIGEMVGDYLIDEGIIEGGSYWIEREKSDGGFSFRIGVNRGIVGRLISTYFCVNFYFL